MNQCTQAKELLVPHQLMDKVNRPPLRQAGSIVHRPGSLELLKKPSRIGDSLFYPDGRIEKEQA
ncbi:hypothetical protein UFOVP381_33 [uncultured Caudovirales phage]|uniref:Uncharacterized protein n=1 Tax=uncultured Caudovirales phage TaxID=2100421 RepID=A0A6J7X030_9CAUD|nr:hypothetical protein UFOVP381_33 [uncultured Caudovirales phage]